jgi:hypothetical protein
MAKELERQARDAAEKALPEGWHIGGVIYDPDARHWTVVAWLPGHPEAVRGVGETEAVALLDLALGLWAYRDAHRHQ